MDTGSGVENISDHEGSANESTNEFNPDFSLCSNSSPSCSEILDNRYWEIRESVHHPVLAVLYALFFFVALGWNIFILIVMIKKRNTFKLPAHVAIFALTVVNVFSCVTIILPTFIVQVTKQWVFFGPDCYRCNVCKVQGAFVVLLVDFALHVLALMSFDRMLLLLKPLTYKKYITKKRIFGLMIVMLVLCILVVTPPFYGFGEIEFNKNLGTCLPRFTGQDGQTYYIGLCLIESMFPLVMLIITSIITYRIIVRRLRTKHLRRKSLHRRKSLQEIEEVSHQGQQHQLAKVFGAFLISYIVAWAPIVVVGFVFVFSGDERNRNYEVPGQVFVFGFFCYLSNVLFQPILETLFISDLRTRVRSVRNTIAKSIRTGTDAVIRRGLQFTHRISHLDFRSSTSELNGTFSASIELHLPTHRTRSSSESTGGRHMVPIRRSQSDSGYEEGSIHGNGILDTSSSGRSLKSLQKKTRFENDGAMSGDTLKVGLETISESGTLEWRAAASPELNVSDSESVTDNEIAIEPTEKQDVPLAQNEDVLTPSSPNAVNFTQTLDSDPE